MVNAARFWKICIFALFDIPWLDVEWLLAVGVARCISGELVVQYKRKASLGRASAAPERELDQ